MIWSYAYVLHNVSISLNFCCAFYAYVHYRFQEEQKDVQVIRRRKSFMTGMTSSNRNKYKNI